MIQCTDLVDMMDGLSAPGSRTLLISIFRFFITFYFCILVIFRDQNVFKKKTKKDNLEWLWISFLVLTVVIGMYTLWRVYLHQKREQEDEAKERETKMVEMIGSFDDDEEMGFLTTK